MDFEDDDIEVIDEPEAPEPAAGAEKKDADPLEDIKTELKALRNEAKEAREDARHWREQATRSTAKTEAAADEEEDEVTVSGDLVQAITDGDHKAVKAILKEMGLVSQKDVDAKITATVARISKDAEIEGQFPGLKDSTSDFFKTAQRHYRELVADNGGVSSPAFIKAAAKLADAELNGNGKRGGETEAERVRRVGSQQSGSRRSSRQVDSEDNDELDREQRTVIDKFRSIGASVTAEGYTKRAKSGVKVSGLPMGGSRRKAT